MTIEERFERIEHFRAGLAEERRKDRDESRQLWRETQRQLGELAVRVNDLAIKIVDVDERLGNRIDQMAEENRKYAVEWRAADDALRQRIEALVSGNALVSGFGEFIATQKEKR